MFWSMGLLLGQFAVAFLALDLTFRYMDLSPVGLRGRVTKQAIWYGAVALVSSALGTWGQFMLAGAGGLAVAAGNWVPWWLLWRFGLRKQLTFLFLDDGGKPVDAEKPDL